MEYKIKVEGIKLEDIHTLESKANAIGKLEEGKL